MYERAEARVPTLFTDREIDPLRTEVIVESEIATLVATGEKAKAMELSVVAGTQRRHQREYVDIYKKVAGGMIGGLTGGNVY